MPLPNLPEDPKARQAVEDLDRRLRNLTRRPELTGARDDPEDALANLITILAEANILEDSTTAT